MHYRNNNTKKWKFQQLDKLLHFFIVMAGECKKS